MEERATSQGIQGPLEVGKGKEIGPFLEPPQKERSPADTWTLAQ